MASRAHHSSKSGKSTVSGIASIFVIKSYVNLTNNMIPLINTIKKDEIGPLVHLY